MLGQYGFRFFRQTGKTILSMMIKLDVVQGKPELCQIELSHPKTNLHHDFMRQSRNCIARPRKVTNPKFQIYWPQKEIGKYFRKL